MAVIADCAADDKAIEVTRCSSSMAFTSAPVLADCSTNWRLVCKVKTGPDLVGHRLALMADNPESLKTGGCAVTAPTPDEPYYMWRRASACLPREIEAVRIAPCPATPSKSIRL